MHWAHTTELVGRAVTHIPMQSQPHRTQHTHVLVALLSGDGGSQPQMDGERSLEQRWGAGGVTGTLDSYSQASSGCRAVRGLLLEPLCETRTLQRHSLERDREQGRLQVRANPRGRPGARCHLRTGERARGWIRTVPESEIRILLLRLIPTKHSRARARRTDGSRQDGLAGAPADSGRQLGTSMSADSPQAMFPLSKAGLSSCLPPSVFGGEAALTYRPAQRRG